MIAQSSLSRPIPEAERATFEEDGVVCLRGCFEPEWVSRLQAAADEVLSGSGSNLEYTAPGAPGRFVLSPFMWRAHPVFRELVWRSPAAAIAGEITGSNKINLFADQLLVKEPGTLDPTLWHHDLPFWPLAGWPVISIWMALDPVTRATGGVEYVAGSHRWPVRFRPVPPSTPELARMRNMDLPPCPNFDGRQGEYRILSWDMEPGDCLVFNALVIHGAAGNSSSTVRRRGFVTRWCGEGVTYLEGDFMQALPEPPGIATGDPLDSELFPVVWRRAEPA